MSAQIASMARRSALVTAVVAAVMMAISAAVGGGKGAIGAAAAIVVVAVFFGLSVVALAWAAKAGGAQAMMLAGLGTYVFKILVLLFLVGRYQNSTAFNAWLFGLTAIVLVLVYDIALAVTFSRTKMLYVEPDGER